MTGPALADYLASAPEFPDGCLCGFIRIHESCPHHGHLLDAPVPFELTELDVA